MSSDDKSEIEWPVRPKRSERQTSPDEPVSNAVPTQRTSRRGFGPILIALAGLVVLLLVLWVVAGRGDSGQDKLNGAEVADNGSAADDPSKRCASKQTYELIKRDLFRRAAQVRGSDQAVYDRLSGYATLRMENPVMENEDQSTGAISCSGSLSLDLPPGVAVAGGRRSLHADVDYTVQPAADDSGTVVTLRNADAIVDPLATLARTASAAQTPPPVATDQPDQTPASDPGTQPPAPAPDEPRETPSAATARPSFNCANARTRGEIAVCESGTLAALDRQMASQFNSAMSDATPSQRALLEQTRSRFLGYRDRCRNDACIADAYRGRIREIRDIMTGDWRR